ncbi:unnamed protein product [Amoebophrya sp. A120]|nr:unnamed protein product [Amoebophrya sp. A120]|eukprot:GSA120T00011208001.1
MAGDDNSAAVPATSAPRGGSDHTAQQETSLDDSVIDALIFDCDGTLVNSMEYFWIGWAQLVEKYKLNFPKSKFYALAGTPVRQIVEQVLDASEGYSSTDQAFVDKFLDEKFQIVEAMRAKGEYPGEITCVTRFAKEAKKQGQKKLAVASSGDKAHVLADLERNGLTELFETIVTREDVVNGKPAPDLFLEAAKRLNVAPEKCRGYEDADLGLESLKRARYAQSVDVRLLPGYPN